MAAWAEASTLSHFKATGTLADAVDDQTAQKSSQHRVTRVQTAMLAEYAYQAEGHLPWHLEQQAAGRAERAKGAFGVEVVRLNCG